MFDNLWLREWEKIGEREIKRYIGLDRWWVILRDRVDRDILTGERFLEIKDRDILNWWEILRDKIDRDILKSLLGINLVKLQILKIKPVDQDLTFINLNYKYL